MTFFDNFIVKIAYLFHDSVRYKNTKNFFYNLLENGSSKHKKYFDFLMIALIMISITILIIEVDSRVPDWLIFFDVVVVTSVFIVEYLLRLWLSDSIHNIIIKEYENFKFFGKKFSLKDIIKTILLQKWNHISSLSSIIDLLAILPSYRPLRVLRIFVLFRLFKLLRHAKDLNGFFEILAVKKFEFYTLFMLLGFLLLISSVLMYIYEGGGINPKVDNFFDAIYWSMVTMSTVGYGDITPVTAAGRVVSLFIIFIGIGLLSFTTSIIVSAFGEKLHSTKQNRIVNQIDSFKSYYLILGYSSTASIIAKWLNSHGLHFLIIDNDPYKIELASHKNYPVLLDDATSQEIYKKITLNNKVKAILCLEDSDVKNISMVLTTRSLNKSINIIAKANKKHNISKFKFIGATTVFDGYKMVGNIAREYLGGQSAFESIYEVLSENGGLLDEYKIMHNSRHVQRPLRELNLNKYYILLLGIKREKEDGIYFNPHNDFILQKNDTLVIMGNERAINYFRLNSLKSEIIS